MGKSIKPVVVEAVKMSDYEVLDPDKLKFVMSSIRDNPRLAQKYVDEMVKLQADNQHRFSIIERDMFLSMKVLFDELYNRADEERNSDSYATLVKLTKDMYEALSKALNTARIVDRIDSEKIKGLKKMVIETDDKVATMEITDKEEEIDDS